LEFGPENVIKWDCACICSACDVPVSYIGGVSRLRYLPEGNRPQQFVVSLFSNASSIADVSARFKEISAFYSPSTIRESVPNVKDAFFPTGKVESTAKE
jgi:hypothetical protein